MKNRGTKREISLNAFRVNKPWKAVSSPQIMMHNGRTVVYQQLEYHCGSGFYRGLVIVPGYATSAPYKKEYKGKTVTAFKFERINDENDRKEIKKCLNERDTTMPLKGTINIAAREITQKEKEQYAKKSEELRKEAKVVQENLLNSMFPQIDELSRYNLMRTNHRPRRALPAARDSLKMLSR